MKWSKMEIKEKKIESFSRFKIHFDFIQSTSFFFLISAENCLNDQFSGEMCPNIRPRANQETSNSQRREVNRVRTDPIRKTKNF